MTVGSDQRRPWETSWPKPQRWRLGNGLTVVHLETSGTSLVTTVCSYRVGAAHEEEQVCGVAHFLEHMMFKGSETLGPGEVDARTQALGGWNNAWTSHDSTAYVFGFASDRWHEALVIEADRMRALALDPEEVDSERRVINEEISMYMDDPWDALELAVQARLYGTHPYGRPILGSVESLAGIDADVLGRFHADFYGPQNAVLAVVGDVGRNEVEDVVEKQFAAVGMHGSKPRKVERELRGPSDLVRIRRHKGETGRLLLSLVAPRPDDDDHPPLVLATTLLGSGRASRLHESLVEEQRLCSRVSAGVTETVDHCCSHLVAEAMPGVGPGQIEEALYEALAQLREEPASDAEMERARSVLASDWIFGHERVHQRAMLAANAETLFDSEFPARQLRAACEATALDIGRIAGQWLDPGRGSVVGWSLPETVGRS